MSFLGFTRDVNVTGGPDGIVNIDPFHVFGHDLETLQSYYWLSLVFFTVVLAALYLVGDSRIGRAWRSLREDALAAELMGMPVSRLKLQAFALGAAVAGLTGTLFASLNTAVFSTDFSTDTLIIVYAMLILGGSGSLWGAILGAIVVDVALEVLRTPDHATLIFFVLIGATLLAKLRPWRALALVLAGTVAVGFAFRAIAGAIWPSALHTQGAMTGVLGRIVTHWLPATTNYHVGDYAFCLLIVAVLALTVVRPLWRNILLAPTLVLAAYDWNSQLAAQPSVTRLIFVGVLLIVLMNARPQGLVGSTRVEIV
jgi:ABC-type branched-subunit amino acid transport system permease subunit